MSFFLIVFLTFTGCSLNSKQKKEHSPKFYFDKAVYYKKKTNYPLAFKNLTKLKQQFFYSSYNEKALLLTADIYFAQQKFPLAVQSYEKHLRLYPQKQKDYVLYQMGLSYKNQLPHRSDHDLSLAEPALQAFNKLLKLKPHSSYRKKAQSEKQKILDKQASRELKTAFFFKSQGWNKAGLKRIQHLIKVYPKSPLIPKALLTGFQLAQILNKDTKEFKNQLIKNYPNSKETKTILQKTKPSFVSTWKQKLL